jgi:Uma2 family endonuclease
MVLTNKMTYAEFRYMEIPDGDTSIYELINGNIMRRSSPQSRHQIVQANLMRNLGNFVFAKQLGRVLGAPMDVVFGDDDCTQPDVFFIKKEREKIIEWDGPVWGSPDLIVEIISKGTAKHDRVDKFKQYQKFGVPEYWLIDPANQSVEVFFLEDKAYVLQQFQEIEGLVKSKVLEGLELDMNDIFA